MAAFQLSGSVVTGKVPSFNGLRASKPTFAAPSLVGAFGLGIVQRSYRGFVVKAATVVSPKYTSVKPLGDRVLIKIKTSEEKTQGGILLPTTAQTKPQAGEVVAIGEGKTIGKTKVDSSLETGKQVVYSKYAGTELEYNGANHLILKEEDVVGVLETEDVKDLKPLNDRVLIRCHHIHFEFQVAEAEQKTAGGLLLTEAAKEKPSIGTVVAVGPGTLDEEGNRKPLTIAAGSTVLYSKYAGNEFKSADGSDYIALRASDVMAVLS
ncbi:20 kDa chaperonin, chloroplastic-like [Asparagus officinalis]|uniref:20 kDa chaperonin, chloroplastic-like n=1 Tax=Asparagus officinalis TaxID=4686 RepID=UPI00098E6C1D|nr:20 kDa chaperonin, chloroplastic-like [Asparagus officinalis]